VARCQAHARVYGSGQNYLIKRCQHSDAQRHARWHGGQPNGHPLRDRQARAAVPRL